MNEEKLLSALSSINTWWKGDPVPERIKKSDNKRKLFYDLSKNCIKKKEIISISGPRQVGKTTLLGQLIDFQIKKGIDPQRIIYIPLDNEIIELQSDNILVDSLKVFLDFIVAESVESLSDKIYVYLDEVQSLENWAKQLKSYYDSYSNIKFIISGSSQTRVYADASESLVGRILFRVVLPFKFREFLEYYLTKRSSKLEFSTVKLRNALKDSLNKNDPHILYRAVTLLKTKISSELPKIKQIMENYLVKGGYPGLLSFKQNYDKALEKLKTDLELTVYKDIYKIFKTRNPSDLMSLLTLLSNSSGQKVNYSNLSNCIGIDRRVVADYINYAKLVYLVDESPFYRTNIKKKIEKMSKVYLTDVGQRNALVGKMDRDLLSDTEMGLVIQTAAFNHARNLKFYLSNHTDYEICYWENQTNEVDIILELPKIVLPIEVKSSSPGKGVFSLKKFMSETKNSRWGMVVNKEDIKLEDNILFIPLWAFLLMC